MKQIILLSLLLICVSKMCLAHGQDYHRYLTIQAYEMLRANLGIEIPIMRDRIGEATPFYIGDRPWQRGFVTTGAWREDEEDPVFRYSKSNPPTITGAGGVVSDFIAAFGGLRPDGFVSSTHFWDADNGDALATDFQGTLWFQEWMFTVPNSYQKALRYLWPSQYGSWYVKYEQDNATVWELHPIGGGQVTFVATGLGIEYFSLIDFYKTGHAKVVAYRGIDLQWYGISDPIEVNFAQGMIDIIVWEVLGRVCHLIQDLSVPAHAHRDEHGLTSDIYEPWVQGSPQGFVWNGLNSGSFLNPYLSTNPIHFLMYTTQQIADHFGSTGPYEGDGNDDIGGDYLTEEIAFLMQIDLSSLGLPTSVNGPWWGYLENIRDKTIPQAIRATAGFLYWFAVEAGLLERIHVLNTGLPSFTDFFYRDNTNDPFPLTGLPSGTSFDKRIGDLMSLRSHYELHSNGTKFFSWSSRKHSKTSRNQNDFTVMEENGNFEAEYQMSNTNALPSFAILFENGLVSPLSTDALLFKNPWYVNPAATNQSNVAQYDSFFPLGLSYKGQPTQYHNGGVFIGAGDPVDLQPPYYTLRTSQVLDRQNMTHKLPPAVAGDWVFTGYEKNQAQLVNDPRNDGTGTYSDPEQYDTKVVIFEQANAEVTAEYKAHRAAQTSLPPTRMNSQRKVAFSGQLHHAVYESAGQIWYVKSTDNGTTWLNEFRVCDGSGGAVNPSIAVCESAVYITYVQNNEVVVRVWAFTHWIDRYRAPLLVPGNVHPVIAAGPAYDGSLIDLLFVTWEDDEAGQHVLKFAALEGTNVLVDNDVLVTGHIQFGMLDTPQYPSVATDPLPPTWAAPNNTFHVVWLENGSIFYTQVSFDRSTVPAQIYGWSRGSGGTPSSVHSVETVHSRFYNLGGGIGILWPALYAPSIGVSPSVARGLSDKVIVAFDVHSFPGYPKEFLVRERVDHWITGPSWSTTATLVSASSNLPQYTAPSVGVLPPQKTGKSTKSEAVRICFNETNGSSAVARFDGSHLTISYLADYFDPNVTVWSASSGNLHAVLSGPANAPFDYHIQSTNNNLNKTNLISVQNTRRVLLQVDTGFAMLGVSNPSVIASGNETPLQWDVAEDSLIIGVNTTLADKMKTESFIVPSNALLVFDRETFGKEANLFPAQSSIVVQIRDVATHLPLMTNSMSVAAMPEQVETGTVSLDISSLSGIEVYVTVDVSDSLMSAQTHVVDVYAIIDQVEKTVRDRHASSRPRAASLSQNHPNPFNPSTDISFFIPEDDKIELAIMNSLGQRVITLADGQHTAGQHTYRFNATGLPSGVYIARLTTNGTILTKKMTLLK